MKEKDKDGAESKGIEKYKTVNSADSEDYYVLVTEKPENAVTSQTDFTPLTDKGQVGMKLSDIGVKAFVKFEGDAPRADNSFGIEFQSFELAQ